ncbi:MAG TPA: ABC transporter substrate-binding protein [Blastocatellia bacterium]|nr:ABC transporter substrate-binding protein [Blastocatellia bacterium]
MEKKEANPMTRKGLLLTLLSLSLFTSASCNKPGADTKLALTPEQFAAARWEEILERARGTTVNYGMWAGDEGRNRYFQGAVADTLRQKYGITLKVVPNSDPAEVVNKLVNEKGAGKASGGSIDFVWINGGNFRTAKQAGVLWGPFAEKIPNIRYYDDEARQRDFGTPIEGYEAPWQKAHFVFAYDTARVPEPPRSIEKLREWIKAHPGRFTYIAPPDFTGRVFIRHLLLHFGGTQNFQTGFDEQLYQKASAAALEYLNDIKPYLWRKGETYPPSLKEADRLFANNEIDFTMSYGPSFASERIARGEYPPTARTFVFDEGTIGNCSFLAIPFNASNVAGALVVINHLMSPTHAIDQEKALGTLFPMRLDRLSPEERAAVEAIPLGPATLSNEELAKHRLPEPDALYDERLKDDWMEKVLRK